MGSTDDAGRNVFLAGDCVKHSETDEEEFE
jgi:hypothetical protein